VVNASFLIPPKHEIVIPVSCVEQGRWQSKSDKFTTSKIIFTARARRTKHKSTTTSLRLKKKFTSNQEEIWDTVSNYLSSSKTDSSTKAFADFYERREKEIENYINYFKPLSTQVGTIVFINGEFIVFDAFGKSATFQKLYPKLLRSYALDAIDSDEFFNLFEDMKKQSVKPVEKVESPTDQQKHIGIEPGDFNYQLFGLRLKAGHDWLDKVLQKAELDSYKSIGLGDDVRFHDPFITGNALVYNEALIHMNFFPN
jgi:hypothetical protein